MPAVNVLHNQNKKWLEHTSAPHMAVYLMHSYSLRVPHGWFDMAHQCISSVKDQAQTW